MKKKQTSELKKKLFAFRIFETVVTNFEFRTRTIFNIIVLRYSNGAENWLL